LRPKDYSEASQTLGYPLEKRRRELGLLQWEAAKQIGIGTEPFRNWEKNKTGAVAAKFWPVVAFVGYDPSPAPETLAECLQAKKRALG